MEDILPDTLSGLLQLGLDDLRRAETAGYYIDMSRWHDPASLIGATDVRRAAMALPKHCVVCMAGAVMACTLDVAATAAVIPLDLAPALTHKLYAIDHLRQGDANLAWDVLHPLGEKAPNDLPPPRRIPSFKSQRSAWEGGINQFIDELRSAGH